MPPGSSPKAPDGSIWLGYRDRTGLSRIEVRGDRLVVQTYNLKSGLRSDQAIFVRVGPARVGLVWNGSWRRRPQGRQVAPLWPAGRAHLGRLQYQRLLRG